MKQHQELLMQFKLGAQAGQGGDAEDDAEAAGPSE